MNQSKELATRYKRKGLFDERRKQLLEDFSAQSKKLITNRIKFIIEKEVNNNPSILLSSKTKRLALLQGFITRDEYVNNVIKKNSNLTKSHALFKDLSTQLAELKDETPIDKDTTPSN